MIMSIVMIMTPSRMWPDVTNAMLDKAIQNGAMRPPMLDEAILDEVTRSPMLEEQQ